MQKGFVMPLSTFTPSRSYLTAAFHCDFHCDHSEIHLASVKRPDQLAPAPTATAGCVRKIGLHFLVYRAARVYNRHSTAVVRTLIHHMPGSC